MMALHEFTARLDRVPDDADDDRLFESGPDDTSPEVVDGRGVLRVSREADDIAEAIISVVRDAENAGLTVVGIDDEDLVSLKPFASRSGRTYESLRLLATGRRGPGNFPAPLSGDGWALYSWAAVADWLTAYTGAPATASEHERVIAAADHLLRARTLMPGHDLSSLAHLIAS